MRYCIQDVNSTFLLEGRYTEESSYLKENRIPRNSFAHLLCVSRTVQRPINPTTYRQVDDKDDSRSVFIYKLFILSEIFTEKLTVSMKMEMDKKLCGVMKMHFEDLRKRVPSKVWEERFNIKDDEREKLKYLVDEYFGFLPGFTCDL